MCAIKISAIVCVFFWIGVHHVELAGVIRAVDNTDPILFSQFSSLSPAFSRLVGEGIPNCHKTRVSHL
jgi:hypothetical protein